MNEWVRHFWAWVTTDPARHALKTGLAAGLTWAAYQLLPPPFHTHSTWAVITCVLVMQSNLGSLLKAARNRWLGTAIGAALGASVGTLFGFHPILLGLAVALNSYVLGRLGLQEAYRLAGATIVLVLLAQPAEGKPWQIGLERFADVLLGISTAVVTQMVFLPASASSHLRLGIAQALADARRFFQAVSDGDWPAAEEAWEAIQEQGARNRDLLSDLRREPRDLRAEEGTLTALAASIEELEHHLQAIEHAAHSVPTDSLHHHLEAPLAELRGTTIRGFDWLTGRLTGQAVGLPPDLDPSVRAAEEALTAVRAAGTGRGLPTEEILRFYSWFYNLRSVARHVASMVRVTAGLSTRR
jgi:uncharacterized membrane protein YccC